MPRQSSRLILFLYGLVPLAVTACVVFVLAVVGGKAVQGYELRQEARAVEQQIDRLKKENRRLSRELDYYSSDAYAEREAREELGLTRPGDVAVILVPSGDLRPTSASPAPRPAPTSTPAPPRVATWQRWLALFLGPD